MVAGSLVPYLSIIVLPTVDLDWTTIGIGAVVLVITDAILFVLGLILIGRGTWRTVRRQGLGRTPLPPWGLFRYGRDADPEFS